MLRLKNGEKKIRKKSNSFGGWVGGAKLRPLGKEFRIKNLELIITNHNLAKLLNILFLANVLCLVVQ